MLQFAHWNNIWLKKTFSSEGEKKYYEIIEKSLNQLSSRENLANLRVDEYFLLEKISKKYTLKSLDLSQLKQSFYNDPFKRLSDKQDFAEDIKIERGDVINAIGKSFDGNFYSVSNSGGTFGAWNDILIKSLYCDKTGYDEKDFFILKLMHQKNGGYLDTHYLLALLLLKENGCFDKKNIDEEINKVSADITKAADQDNEFSDLYAERITFLYMAGKGSSVKKEWIDLIANNFSTETGWIDPKSKNGFSVHVNGLALLSIIYYLENKSYQSVY